MAVVTAGLVGVMIGVVVFVGFGTTHTPMPVERAVETKGAVLPMTLNEDLLREIDWGIEALYQLALVDFQSRYNCSTSDTVQLDRIIKNAVRKCPRY